MPQIDWEILNTKSDFRFIASRPLLDHLLGQWNWQREPSLDPFSDDSASVPRAQVSQDQRWFLVVRHLCGVSLSLWTWWSDGVTAETPPEALTGPVKWPLRTFCLLQANGGTGTTPTPLLFQPQGAVGGGCKRAGGPTNSLQKFISFYFRRHYLRQALINFLAPKKSLQWAWTHHYMNIPPLLMGSSTG